MSPISFPHRQYAHCESGVTANLLHFHGLPVSEPMAFGIGAGIFFAHLPFIKVNGTPATTFRTWPGTIFKNTSRRLHLSVHSEKFRSPAKAMEALDSVLATGTPVGMLSSVFYLPYLPEAYRFHFNAHNIVVYGKENGQYLVSDPVLPAPACIAPEDLVKARFAKGIPEPKGFMYYIKDAPHAVDYAPAIKAGIRQTCFFMLSPPVPWFGHRAIFLLAEKVQYYPEKYPPRKASLYLGNIIRMQEEIGTGGAGFRYLYAAFLQEAGRLLQRGDLLQLSEELTLIGDQWRSFAYHAARQVKDRKSDLVSYRELSNLLRLCGTAEKTFFKKLEKVPWA
jgi:hypothetical protein